MKLPAINTLLTIKIIHEPAATDAPFVAYVSEFDISSAGRTQDEAIVHVKEALNIVLHEAERDGTIDELVAGSTLARPSRKSSIDQTPRIVIEPFVAA